MRNVIIIPARMTSVRLPRKPLLEAGGKSLLQWTHETATKSAADRVFVTTPDQEIIEHCRKNGMRCIKTAEHIPTGTHRCAEAIWELPDAMRDDLHCVINLQVDEPLISPDWLDSLMELFPGRPIQTVLAPMNGRANDVHSVKAIASFQRCHWFTRSPVPLANLHVGVYAFDMNTLYELSTLSPTAKSTAESLEQLAWLEHGYEMRGIYVPDSPLSINTQDNWEDFKRMVES